MKISIILTTKNNERTIKKCVESIISQIGDSCELVVVDNFSTDDTYNIIKNMTVNTKNIKLFQRWPERNIQRSLWFEKSIWKYIYFIDSDMYLPKWFIQELTNEIDNNTYKCFIVPEKNETWKNYRTKVKAFEREFYQWDSLTEAARIFESDLYKQIWWFDSKMISCEDRELTERAQKTNIKIWRLASVVIHDEWEITLSWLLQKKKYYWWESISYIQNWWSRIKNIIKLTKRVYFFRPVFYTKRRLYSKRLTFIPWLITMLSLELVFWWLWLINKIIYKNKNK